MVINTHPAPKPCPRCSTALDSHDLRCPVCGLVVTATTAQPDHVDTVLRCTGCGASVMFDPQKNVLSCAFCGSTFEVEQPDDPLDPMEWFVPFTVTLKDAHAAVHHWLKHQDILRPTDLTQMSVLDSVRAIWWAAWVIDADCDISYAADANIGTAPQIWRPVSGRCSAPFRHLVFPATRGLKKSEVDWLLLNVPTDDLSPKPIGPPDSPTAAMAEVFELQRSGATPEILAAILTKAQQHVASSGVLPGTAHKNIKVSPLLSGLSTKRVGFPVHILTFRYKDELFRVLVDGRSAARVFGDAPFSTARLMLLLFGVLVILLLAVVTLW